jgi:hypothetical protein
MDVTTPLAVRVTLVGFKETVGPVGETTTDNDTVPVKLLTLDTVMVEVVEEPADTDRENGETEVVKSGNAPTMTVIVTARDSVPLTPVTVTEYCP